MTFSLPALPDVLFRLWRLRRLIAFAVMPPLVAFAMMGLIGWNGVSGSPVGLAIVGVSLLAIIGSHAAVFPNAQEETLTISLVLAVFALFLATMGGSVLGWILFLGFAFWMMLTGPGRLLALQAGSVPHKPSLTARIRVEGSLEAARRWFPLRPGVERGQYRCGTVGEDGAFPVWYDMPMVDMFADLDLPETPEMEEREAFHREVALDETDEEAFAMNKALQDEYLAVALDPDAPSFWAQIEADEPEYQRTRLFTRDRSGVASEISVVEHRFRAARTGCVVTETDTPESFPIGQTFGMWLSDFQMDGLAYLRDLLQDRETLALKVTHRWSIMMLLARWFIARRLRRASEI